MFQPSGRSGPERQLTALAQKYTHPTGEGHEIIARTGKSGLTPVRPPLPYGPFPTANQRDYLQELENYQRGRNPGWTLFELVQLEAFAPLYNNWLLDGMVDGGIGFDQLNVPIHKLFVRTKWDQINWTHKGRVALGNEGPGFWTAQNDVVWKAMEPCLKLATLYLNNSYAFAWWDALFFGDYEYIEKDIPDESKGKRLLRFRPRSHLYVPKGAKLADVPNAISKIADNIQYNLISGWVEPYTGLPRKESNGEDLYLYGETSPQPYDFGTTAVYAAYETLRPLTRHDLTSAERKHATYNFASIVLHETCHAIWCQIESEKPPRHETDYTEPYFEDEPAAEIGFSMEHAIFGGEAKSLTDFDPTWGKGIPSGTIFRGSFFIESRCVNYFHSETPIIPPLPDDWKYRDLFPIPIGWFEDIHRPEFWVFVRNYGGGEQVHMGPRTEGMRRMDNAPEIKTKIDRYRGYSENLIKIHDGMTDSDLQAISFENRRRTRVHRIVDTLINAAVTSTNLNQNTLQPFMDTTPSLGGTQAEYRPFSDPAMADIGKSFWSLSGMLSEDDTEYTPPCPRYDDFSQYILNNRDQGKLCFDTMQGAVSEQTLYQYIETYGGLNITLDEFNAFLKNCQSRSELFRYSTSGTGIVEYRRLGPPPSPDLSNQQTPSSVGQPSEEDINSFHFLSQRIDWTIYLQDFDFEFLLRMLQWRDPVQPSYLTADILRNLVDWEDLNRSKDLLWCWGPGGVVRRRVDNWPLT